MKCRIHSTDLSSAVGVCASCLRQRLFLLISAQSQQTHQLQLYESHERRNFDPPPPLDFPHSSVSPYIYQRKIDGVSLDLSDSRFHSTPQIGGAPVSESIKKKKRGKFSFIINLFKSRSDKSETDSMVGSKSKSMPKFVGQKIPIPIPNPNQTHRVSDRGMSPERWPYDGEEEEEETSSRSSDSREPTWKQTPVSTSTTKRRHSNISGLAFCLSPLVRASPNRNWNRNSLPPESGGSVTASRKAARLAVANSFGKNRSKKMADYGGGRGFDHRC